MFPHASRWAHRADRRAASGGDRASWATTARDRPPPLMGGEVREQDRRRAASAQVRPGYTPKNCCTSSRGLAMAARRVLLGTAAARTPLGRRRCCCSSSGSLVGAGVGAAAAAAAGAAATPAMCRAGDGRAQGLDACAQQLLPSFLLGAAVVACVRNLSGGAGL